MKKNPYIFISKKPVNLVNNYNDPDFSEDDVPIFQGYVADRKMRLSFFVMWDNESTSEDESGEFKVSSFGSLYLHGIDRGKNIDNKELSGTMSANPELIQILFNDTLSMYGIRLNKVSMHDYKDYESIDFSFVDEDKKEELLADIIEACKKAIL